MRRKETALKSTGDCKRSSAPTVFPLNTAYTREPEGGAIYRREAAHLTSLKLRLTGP